MSMLKKSLKSKFLSEELSDFLNESQFLKDSPKTKKTQKRQRTDDAEGISSTMGQLNPKIGKNKKVDGNFEVCRESRQKLFEVMSRQLESRKLTNDNHLKSLSEIVTGLEADHNALKENEQQLQHLTGAFMKCIQQATSAHKQKLKALKEIHASFQKDAEGLLKRGGMKPDDRPLWFDVYKAFPPITEPKFARPKVENTTIRPILYKEDVIRSKFHANGHGLGAINMHNQSGETQIKRLMQQHEKLKSEGVSEDELIAKAVSTLSSDRQQNTVQNTTPRGPDASGVLSEVSIKDIFKD